MVCLRAASAGPRRTVIAGLWVTAATGALVAACGSDGAKDTSTSLAGTPAEQRAAQLDCAKVTDADALFENARWPFTESLDCWIDGRPSIRLHSFAAAAAPEVGDRFAQRYGGEGLNPCPDGGDLSRQFVVLGDNWAAVTTTSALRDLVVDRLAGASLDSDLNTTPVSYPAVDPCAGSPPDTAPQ